MKWSLEQLFGYYLTWSATRAYLKSHGDAFLLQARKRLQDLWGNPTRQRTIVMPLAMRLGRLG
ncbi:MAG: hypothetical protein ACRETG_04015 [Steroidobacteraceae bacterium]